MDRILELQNPLSWDVIFTGTFTGSPIPKSKVWTRLPNIVPSFLIESCVVGIYCESTMAEDHWTLAGNVQRTFRSGLISPTALDATIVDSKILLLNKLNIIRFDRLTEDYALQIVPRRWLKNLSVSVRVYNGIDENELELALARIETKLDNFR